VIVIGICAVAAMVSIEQFQLYDWCMPIIVGVIITSGVAAHVVSRYCATMELS
jgi:hypothetical protein